MYVQWLEFREVWYKIIYCYRSCVRFVVLFILSFIRGLQYVQFSISFFLLSGDSCTGPNDAERNSRRFDRPLARLNAFTASRAAMSFERWSLPKGDRDSQCIPRYLRDIV